VNKAYISTRLRRQLKADAGDRCGYCRSSEVLTAIPLVVDHIKAEALGGLTVRENLWLACTRCNGHKTNRTHAVDPVTSVEVPLFNPRAQVWAEHFAWSDDGLYVVGLTAIGRATIQALHLNRPLLVDARRFWVQFGLHPPDR
jgi:hypothetical protein